MNTEKSMRILLLDVTQERHFKELRTFIDRDSEDTYLDTKYIAAITSDLMKNLEKEKLDRNTSKSNEYQVLMNELNNIVKNTKAKFEHIIIDLTFLYCSGLTLSTDEVFTSLSYLIQQILIIDEKIHISLSTGLFFEGIEEKETITSHEFALVQVAAQQFCASLVSDIVQNHDSRYTKGLYDFYARFPKMKVKERVTDHINRKIWIKKEIYWCANLIKKSTILTFNPDLQLNESNLYFKILADLKKIINVEHPILKYKTKRLSEFKAEILDSYLSTRITSLKTMKQNEGNLPDINILKYHMNQASQYIEERNNQILETKFSDTIFFEVGKEDNINSSSSDSESDSSRERNEKRKNRKRRVSSRDESVSSSGAISKTQAKNDKGQEEENIQNEFENMMDFNTLVREENENVKVKLHNNIQHQLGNVKNTMKKHHSSDNGKNTKDISSKKLLENALASEIAVKDLLGQKFISTSNIGQFMNLNMVEDIRSINSELMEESSEIRKQLNKRNQAIIQMDFKIQIKEYLNDTSRKLSTWLNSQRKYKTNKKNQWVDLKTKYENRNTEIPELDKEIKQVSDKAETLLEDSTKAWVEFNKIIVEFNTTKKCIRLNQMINKVSPLVDQIHRNLIQMLSGKVYYITETPATYVKEFQKCSPRCVVTERTITQHDLIACLDIYTDKCQDTGVLTNDNGYEPDHHLFLENLKEVTIGDNSMKDEEKGEGSGSESENDGENKDCVPFSPKMTNPPNTPNTPDMNGN